MKNYRNKSGIVERTTRDSITIDGIIYTAGDDEGRRRITLASPQIGDTVEFNHHCLTNDIIYLRNLTRSKAYNRYSSYVEDPRDPDEVHDMEMVYGNDFEVM